MRIKQAYNWLAQVFWYDSDDQILLLYTDYIELMQRKGFQPPRYIVEANIREIAQRIITRSKVSSLLSMHQVALGFQDEQCSGHTGIDCTSSKAMAWHHRQTDGEGVASLQHSNQCIWHARHL